MSNPVLVDGDEPRVDAGRLSELLLHATTRAGAGDLAGATRIIDEVFAQPAPRHWPDATLGLLLYHRTVNACLGAALGQVAADPERCRSDIDMARTLLPDIRLGWLADAAMAAGDGRWASVPFSAAAVSARRAGAPAALRPRGRRPRRPTWGARTPRW